MDRTVASPFGRRLREWRQARKLSQLDLASNASTTSRHVSFLETGRSRPSHEMVIRLCEALDVPLRARNDLLEAAGLAPAYRKRALGTSELAPHRDGVQRLLDAHDPHPGLVYDLDGRVLLCNAGARRLFGDGIEGSSLYEWMMTNEHALENWEEMAWSALDRLRRQLADDPFDTAVAEWLAAARQRLGDGPRPLTTEPVVCPRFRVDGQVVALIGMAGRFEMPSEITLEEIRIELFFPADSDAAAFFADDPHRRR